LSAFTLALSQLTKSFAIYLYGVAGAFLLFWTLGSSSWTGAVTLKRRSVAPFVGLVLLSFVLVVNAGFCFDRPFTPLSAYHFQSSALVRLQGVPFVRSLLVPVPYPFLQGLDMMKDLEQRGISFGNVYLLGKLGNRRDPTFHGFKSYYAVALFFKEPIAFQILFSIGLIAVLKNLLAGQCLVTTFAAT
jgi:hypothetical protein